MRITKELTIENFTPWAGAVSTWERLEDERETENFIYMLEDFHPDGIDERELNDLLWHDSDWCLELVGIELED